MESIIRDRIQEHMSDLFTPNQHCFINGNHVLATQLLTAVSTWTNSLENSAIAIAI